MKTVIALAIFIGAMSTSAHADTLKFFCAGQNAKGDQLRVTEDSMSGKLILEKLDVTNAMPPYGYKKIAAYEVHDFTITPDVVSISGTESVFTTGISGRITVAASRTGTRDTRTFYAGKISIVPTVSTVRPVAADVFEISCEARR